MFVRAFRLASAFTRPVVISTRAVDGTCRGVVAACTLVNRDGWVLTAAHILGLVRRLEDEAARYRAWRAEVRDLERATASFDSARKRKLRHLERPAPGSARDCSVWWGADGAVLRDVRLMPASDLALGRLQPFEPAPADGGPDPVFKLPDADYAPGRSLCRLGFPFHEIVPVWDKARGVFVLPPEAFPIPLFPIEGMLTRFLSAPPPDPALADPASAAEGAALGRYIETSSPGLQGQSGGPIFDADGAVWAIQSHTRHLPLGFRPRAPGEPKGPVAHQFLNVGVGVHAQSILALLDEAGVAHKRTADRSGRARRQGGTAPPPDPNAARSAAFSGAATSELASTRAGAMKRSASSSPSGTAGRPSPATRK